MAGMRHNQIIVQSAPADVFPTLYADVDEHKRLGPKPDDEIQTA
jgi:hypothetical protein